MAIKIGKGALLLRCGFRCVFLKNCPLQRSTTLNKVKYVSIFEKKGQDVERDRFFFFGELSTILLFLLFISLKKFEIEIS